MLNKSQNIDANSLLLRGVIEHILRPPCLKSEHASLLLFFLHPSILFLTLCPHWAPYNSHLKKRYYIFELILSFIFAAEIPPFFL